MMINFLKLKSIISKDYSLFILVVLLFSFLTYFLNFVVNFPIQDDVNYILLINKLNKSSVFSIDFLQSLLKFDNDHAYVVPRLFVLFDYWIWKNLDFSHIILTGMFEFILICCLIYIEFKKINRNIKFLLPIIFILFQPQYYELFNWSITSTQHFSVVLFSFLSFICIQSKNRTYTHLGAFFALCASFSFGNGFLTFLLIIFTSIIQKEFRKTLIISVYIIPNILIYLLFYEKGQEAFLEWNWQNFLIIFFALIGGVVKDIISSNVVLCVIVGICTISLVLFNFFQNIRSKLALHLTSINLLLYFCVLSIFIISVARSSSNIYIYQSSRYLFYSPLIIICLYISSLESSNLKIFKSKMFYYLTLLFCVIVNISSFYSNTEQLINQKKKSIADSENWHSNFQTSTISPKVYQNVQMELIKSYQAKIWDVPLELSQTKIKNQSKELLKIQNKQNGEFIVESNLFNQASYQINLGVLSIIERYKSDDWYAIFKLNKNDYQFITPIYLKKGPKKQLMLKLDYFSNEAYTNINNSEIPEGKYEMQLLRKSNSNTYYTTDVLFEFKSKKMYLE